MGQVIQMYAAAAPAAGLAQIDVPMNGHIVGVDWNIFVTVGGADANETVELSFSSALQNTVNDSRSVISTIAMYSDLTTSGAQNSAMQKYVRLPDIPVGMGERLYIHAFGTAVTITIHCCVHFDFDLDRASVRRR